jgi:hypothetical protein
VPNEIGRLCEQIDITIDAAVQNSLNQFQHDCQRLVKAVDTKLVESGYDINHKSTFLLESSSALHHVRLISQALFG